VDLIPTHFERKKSLISIFEQKISRVNTYVVASSAGNKIVAYNWIARFFLVQHTKTGKNIPKLPQNVPNCHKIYQIAVKSK
jgi:hypothetical protein